MVKKELETKIEILLDGYIKAELDKLKNKEVNSIKLNNVSLCRLEKHIKYNTNSLNINTSKGNYNCFSNDYLINGCMYDNTVSISLK